MKMNTLILRTLLILMSTSRSSSRNTNNLPESVKPLLYDLTLHLIPNTDGFNGRLTTTISVDEESTTVQLRAAQDYIHIKTVHELNENETISCEINRTNDFEVGIICPGVFSTGIHTLYFEYEGWYSGDGLGFFQSTYLDSGNIETMYVTNLVPNYASRLLPCFDEPKFKAQFDITVIHPDEYTALGNMPVVSQEKGPDHYELTTTFDTTPSMPTYSLVIVVSKLAASKTFQQADLNFTVYLRPNLQPSLTVALKSPTDLIIAMGNYTNINYTDFGDGQINMVALPGFPVSAAHNWGTILLKELHILDETHLTSAENQQDIIRTMAREIAFQWFGHYTTPNWWSDVWIDLGFATYFEYFLPDQVAGLGLHLMDQFVSNVFHLALEEDSYYPTPLASKIDDVQTNYQIANKLDSLTALKGASIIYMIRNYITEMYFQKGVQQFMAENSYGVTTTESLCRVMDVCDFINNYVTVAGYPLVSLRLNQEGLVEASQEIFSLIEPNKTTNIWWELPLLYLSGPVGTESNQTQMLHSRSKSSFFIELDSPENWIVLNTNQTSFFRVNYDSTLWLRIIEAIKDSNMSGIPVINRAGLLDDILHVARVGKVDYTLVFNLADYLRNEVEHYPWAAYFRGVNYILDHSSDIETVELLKEASLYWINEAFPTINRDVDPIHVNVLRDTLVNEWKCSLGDEECLRFANESYFSYKADPGYPTSLANHNLRYMACCTVLRMSTDLENDYQFILDQCGTHTSEYVRRKLIQSLGCSPTQEYQRRFLNELLDEETLIEKAEAESVITAVMENRNDGVDSVITFLEENLETLVEKYNGYISFRRLIISIAKKVNQESKLEKLLELVNSTGIVENYDELFEQSTGFISMNKIWADTYSGTIKFAIQQLGLPIRNITDDNGTDSAGTSYNVVPFVTTLGVVVTLTNMMVY